MNELRRLIRVWRIVTELKRRQAFQSLILTNTKLEIDYWNGERVVTGDEHSATLYLNAMRENDRREIEWHARYGRSHASRRA